MSLKEQNLTEKLRSAEETLSSNHGAFTLFGLFEQEDKPGRLDLVASAPWLTSSRAGIQVIVDGLAPYFQAEEWGMVRQIVPLRPDEPFVQTLLRLLRPVEHDVWETGPFFTADYRVTRAIIITANPPSVSREETQEATLAA